MTHPHHHSISSLRKCGGVPRHPRLVGRIASEYDNEDRFYVRLDEPIDLDTLRAEEGIIIDAFNRDEY